MLASLVLSVCCLSSGDDVPATKPSVPAARPHQAESEDLVRRALTAEAEGHDTDRLTNLARAVALDSDNVLARSLMGLVEYRGRWQRPEAVATAANAERDQRLRDYLTKRAATPIKADSQARLADWCAKNGLQEQARAHYRAAVQLDPARESAWRHLGYEKKGNRWVRPEDAAAEKAEADAQKKADRSWRPRLEKLREGLISKDANRREKAEKDLMEITEPRAVPMILSLLTSGGERLQQAAVQVLERIEGPKASNALVMLAILSPFESVRVRASSALLYRDPGDVIGTLVGLLRRPLKYKVIPGGSPGLAGQLLVDGEAFDLRKLYRYPDLPQAVAQVISLPSIFLKNLDLVDQFLASTNAMEQQFARQETIRRTLAVEQRIEDDARQLEQVNTTIQTVNGRILPILRVVTGRDDGPNPESWKSWWANELGYVSSSSSPNKPTYEDVESMPAVNYNIVGATFHHGCFAAGTPVHTTDGLRAIETLRVGDLVLSQNVTDGTLAYLPVTGTHVNGPADTLRVVISGEAVVATGIHRFWKVGEGWVMARNLKPGDRLRMAGRSGLVESVMPDARQKIYNLDVDGNRDYFVGNTGFLVNDYGTVEPVETPFDRLRTTPEVAGNP
ncbi:polymorphic toxin-type HINT domain-containing protein [Aquisphaera insulae]|uniref:polymorphic toxin-type HINT domain-containing protein n=1 Tax=Aquisphaera insulae TaxID=2712864 RepID=UPI0013EC0CA9|nr:polymorphic toxin-type HINT domain-containing protein [Aquisphaera insulae]